MEVSRSKQATGECVGQKRKGLPQNVEGALGSFSFRPCGTKYILTMRARALGLNNISIFVGPAGLTLLEKDFPWFPVGGAKEGKSWDFLF